MGKHPNLTKENPNLGWEIVLSRREVKVIGSLLKSSSPTLSGKVSPRHV
jgi:hypothetical protein